ncbi:MAG: acyl-ACP--UDP-N-acetylglucosamine O-acyltransferase [Burkholderiales bacterium]
MIHATAIIDRGAKLAADVEVGPYAVISAGVEIGSGTTIGTHTTISGPTRIGNNNRIYSHVSLGEAPQDKKYQGESTSLEIGNGNTIREFCTINRGTIQDVGVTRIGNDNWIMAYVHVAHDCQIGNNTIFANSVQLAGHVHVGDYAILGGFTGVHQFVHIGAHSFMGIATILTQDVPTYITVSGNPAKPYSINSEGLNRRGFSADAIAHIKRAYKTLYRKGLSFDEARAKIATQCADCPEIKVLSDFLQASTRGIVR